MSDDEPDWLAKAIDSYSPDIMASYALIDIAQSLRVMSNRTPDPNGFDPSVIEEARRHLEHLEHDYEIEVEMPKPPDD